MKGDKERSVMFAIPAYDEKVGCGTMLSIFTTIGEFVNRTWEIGVECCPGNPAVHLARNWLVRRFLQSPSTDLFFIDSDISCEPGAIMKMIDHPVDVVLGLYRSRRPVETYTFLAMEHGRMDPDPDTGLIEVRGGPAGFMRIRRHVIEKMIERLPPEEYASEPFSPSVTLPILFQFTHVDGNYAGEDIGFCLKWRQMGGRVWIDPDLMLHHTGQMRFSANFKRSLETKVNLAKGESLIERERIERERESFESLVGR